MRMLVVRHNSDSAAQPHLIDYAEGMDEQVLLKYDGPALNEHRMDVRDLAPALLGLADAVQAAGRLLDPNTDLKLDVTATNEGSFEILMLLEESALGTLFAGTGITALANGLTLSRTVKDTITGAIRIIKGIAQHGGQPQVQPPSQPTSQTTDLILRFPDGATMEASFPSWQVLKDPKAMAGLAKLAEPLKPGAIDSLDFGDTLNKETISYHEKHAFVPETSPDVLRDDTGQMLLEIVDVKFREAKWRVSDGDAVFNVSIEDEQFLAKVKAREIRFADGDSLRAEVRTVQRMVNVRPRTERTVLHVYEVLEAPPEQEGFVLPS